MVSRQEAHSPYRLQFYRGGFLNHLCQLYRTEAGAITAGEQVLADRLAQGYRIIKRSIPGDPKSDEIIVDTMPEED